MTPKLIGRLVPGSTEWSAARTHRVGGSEAAVCLGISPFESPFSLWHRKAGLVGPIEQTPILEWGNRLEAAVLRKWLDDHPDHALDATGTTWLSVEDPFMVANPDAIVFNPDMGRELIEVKTSPYGDGWGPSHTDEYPVYYRCQVLHYMHVLDITTAHLIVLISGYDYREYDIVADADARHDLGLIIDAERAFVDSLPGGPNERRPSIDSHDATYQTIRELHPDIDADESVEIRPTAAESYLSACQAVKDAEADKRQAASTVLDIMKSAQYATYNGDRIASRQARGDGKPFLVASRTKKEAA